MAGRTSEITQEDAKTYLARKDLFQIFESLLTALLYKRPENPVEYIEKCLQTAKITKNLEWDSFLDIAYPEKGNSNEAKLKADVKGAYEMIFKTEPKSEQKASS